MRNESPSAAPATAFRRLSGALPVVLRQADIVARDLPPRLRPFGRFLFVLSILVLAIVSIPLWPLFWWWQGRWFERVNEKLEPTRSLVRHLERIEAEDSPAVAIEQLRSVFDRVRVAPGPVDIAPYGRFEWSVCQQDLAGALFARESRAGHLDLAAGVAELMCATCGEESPFFAGWLVSRAKCLVKLDRGGEAKALLFQHRDPNDADYKVNAYLEQLSAGRK